MGSAGLPDRFWAKVDRSGACWLWTGARDRGGYGRFRTSTGHVPAHRALFVSLFGSVAPQIEICHTCDTPACVRPSHLFAGTHAQNMADMHAKGRAAPPPVNTGWQQRAPERVPRGERHPRAKLTDADVAEMRRMRAEGLTLSQIGARFAVGKSQVSRIARGLVRAGG